MVIIIIIIMFFGKEEAYRNIQEVYNNVNKKQMKEWLRWID